MNSSILLAIRTEQARSLNRSLPGKAIGNALAVLAMTAGLSPWVASWHIFLWATLILGNELLTGIVLVRQWRGWSFANLDRQLRFLTGSTVASGVFWGLGWLLFVIHPTVEKTPQYIYLCTFAMLNSAVLLRGHYLPLYLGFLVPSGTMTLAYLTWSISDISSLALTLGTGLYICFITIMGRSFSKAYVETLRLRFENGALVDQLTKQKQAAEAANLAKSRFLAAASHDLRQPMHALTLYLSALRHRELPGDSGQLLQSASRCANTMDEMFRALLDMSRLDATLVKPKPRLFVMNEVLEQVRLQFAPVAAQKRLRLDVVPCSVAIYSDIAMVRRVVSNLVANAVNYTTHGRVLLGVRRRSASLCIRVYDTGPGIPPEHLSSIFEEFYQLGNKARDRTMGLGLGLAIVRRLSLLLGGEVTVQSVVGRGSCFSLELPVRGERQHLAIQLDESDRVPEPTKRQEWIAVIDDDPNILHATRALLVAWKYQVIAASSAAEAIKRFNEANRTPDVIICDFRLPTASSGLAVIAELRSEFNADIPALLITGDTGPEPLRMIHQSGLPVLHKPITDSALHSALASIHTSAARR